MSYIEYISLNTILLQSLFSQIQMLSYTFTSTESNIDKSI